MRTSVYIFTIILSLLTNHGALKADNNNDRKPSSCAPEKTEVEMQFAFDSTQNMLKISFNEEEIKKNDPEQFDFFRTHSTFPFEEEFELPEDICRSLGTQKNIVIRTGEYPVKYRNGVYEIYICL